MGVRRPKGTRGCRATDGAALLAGCGRERGMPAWTPAWAAWKTALRLLARVSSLASWVCERPKGIHRCRATDGARCSSFGVRARAGNAGLKAGMAAWKGGSTASRASFQLGFMGVRATERDPPLPSDGRRALLFFRGAGASGECRLESRHGRLERRRYGFSREFPAGLHGCASDRKGPTAAERRTAPLFLRDAGASGGCRRGRRHGPPGKAALRGARRPFPSGRRGHRIKSESTYG